MDIAESLKWGSLLVAGVLDKHGRTIRFCLHKVMNVVSGEFSYLVSEAPGRMS